jgi:hypothetical protein
MDTMRRIKTRSLFGFITNASDRINPIITAQSSSTSCLPGLTPIKAFLVAGKASTGFQPIRARKQRREGNDKWDELFMTFGHNDG